MEFDLNVLSKCNYNENENEIEKHETGNADLNKCCRAAYAN